MIRCGFGSNRVAELCADTAAEIQTETAGLLVAAAVVAGEALFKDPGQILRRDADAGVADDERFGRFQINADAALARIFERVRQNLLHDEPQPLLIRHA